MIDCKIIQDLLPNYIEKLTSEETNNYIQKHLKGCKECNEIFESMKKDLEINSNEDYEKETKYLKKYNKKMNILKTIVCTMIAIFIAILVRKMIILIDVQNKISKYIDSNNYYVKTYYYANDEINIRENFVLGEKSKEIEYFIASGERMEVNTFYKTRYCDGNQDNYYIETQGHKLASLNKTPPIERFHIRYDVKTDNIWQLILIALTSDISTENCNGKECYKINLSMIYDDGKLTKYKSTEYINKEDGLVIRYIDEQNINLAKGEGTGQILDYKYEFENVTQEEFIEPDIAEYEINNDIIGQRD